jgi:hypothetical protein
VMGSRWTARHSRWVAHCISSSRSSSSTSSVQLYSCTYSLCRCMYLVVLSQPS